MTYDEIVQAVADELNLTSATALARIGREVNRIYRQVCAEVGLQTTLPGTKVASTVVSRRTLVFPLVKVSRVYDNTTPTQPRMLGVQTFDTLRNWAVIGDPPQNYAIYATGAQTTTIFLDSNPSSIYPLTADGLEVANVLSGVDEPRFPENYHDILIHGVKDIELRKLEKASLADAELALYGKRLEDIQYFLAKNAYLQINQGNYDQETFVQPYLV